MQARGEASGSEGSEAGPDVGCGNRGPAGRVRGVAAKVVHCRESSAQRSDAHFPLVCTFMWSTTLPDAV